MISKVRTYIKNIIAAYDSDFKEWDSPFDSSDIPETAADKLYFIKYDVDSISESDLHIENNVSMTVEFFFKTFNDRIGVYDSGMDSINAIMREAISIPTIEAFKSTDTNPIFKVFASSLTASPLDANDNQLIITLELTCGISQAKC